MSGLETYCEHTSLHGWYYIAKDKKYWKIVWTIIVLASIVVASLFIYKSAEDFTKSTVVTTIQSTTVPLSEVYFPAVTVCNINQVRYKIQNRQTRQNKSQISKNQALQKDLSLKAILQKGTKNA